MTVAQSLIEAVRATYMFVTGDNKHTITLEQRRSDDGVRLGSYQWVLRDADGHKVDAHSSEQVLAERNGLQLTYG